MLSWKPPSSTLHCKNGIWLPERVSPVSYPEDGNDACLSIEETSYWFAHRNACVLALLAQFPPDGQVYDIGGGNGYVSGALNKAGIETVLVEPGSGARRAADRGMRRVIQGTLEDAGFEEDSLPAAGVFDVVEHIDDDISFLSLIHRTLRPGGALYGTVPASQALWSGEDVQAGHFRRYDLKGIASRLHSAGFKVEFVAYFFSWLVLPVFLFRALPFRLFGAIRKSTLDSSKRDHSLPGGLSRLVNLVHGWELDLLSRRCSPVTGSSLLFCARKPFVQ
jgi:SAM-dependent methyltransferase